MEFSTLSVKNVKRASRSSPIPYLHYDLIDQEGLTTITMTVSGDVIQHHEEKIRTWTYVRVENFGVKRKHADDFQNFSVAKYTCCHSSSF